MQGIIQKVMTLTDGSVRFFVDVPLEIAPDNIKEWMFEAVTIERETKYHAKKKTRIQRTKEKKRR